MSRGDTQRIYQAIGEHFARNEKAMLTDPDGLPVLRGARSDIDWAERIRAGMFDRLGHPPDIVERLKSIESAGWFITWRDNQSGIEEWETQVPLKDLPETGD